MCGIHGFINGNKKAEINSDDFIKSAFITNMVRGTDSAGIAVVQPSGYNDVAKLPVAGLYLLSHKPANSLISRARTTNTASICHVRAATSGSITLANTHPFVIEDDGGVVIVGVHNGTLQNWKNKKGGNDWDVDSAWALSRILAEKSDAFEEFTGAFAFVWWTSDNPNVINMARNKERPMFVAYTEDDNMVYASESGMIHWLCERHRIKIKGNIRELEEDKLYQFDISNPTKVTKSGELPKPKVVSYTNNYRGSAYAYKNTVEKLDAIFARIRKEEPQVQGTLKVDQDTGSLVTREEMMDAHQMNVLGYDGVFTAMGTDDRTGHLYGTFESDEYSGESHAVMRDVPDDIDWVSGGSWNVKVQGVADSGNDFIFIVSKPLGEALAV